MPPLLARLLKRPGRCEATSGVGDEDLNGSPYVLDPFPHGLDVAEFGDVAEDFDGFASLPLDVGPNFRERRSVPAMRRHPRSLPRKQPPDRSANPPRTARPQVDPIFQEVHVRTP